MKTKILKYTVIYSEEAEGGFTVTVPSLAGLVTYGKNLVEAKKMAVEAINLYLEDLSAEKEEIPSDKNSLIGSVDLEYPRFHA